VSCLSLDPVVKIELVQELDGQAVVNTLYARKFSGSWTVPDATLLALDVIDWWDTNIAPQLTTAVELNLVRMTDLSDPDGFIIEETSGLPMNGSVASESHPNSIAVVVSFRTGLRGRRNRGRNFIAGFPNAAIANNDVDSGVASALVTAYEVFNTLLTSDHSCAHVVYSCRDIGGESLAGVGVPITTYIVNPIVGTQRRRLPGRGS